MSSPLYVKPFVWLLKSEDSQRKIESVRPPVICVASYSAKSRTELAAATRANMELALEMRRTLSPGALIVFGSCTHAFPGGEEFESAMKADMCRAARAPYIDAGPIANSITEMEAWRDILSVRRIYPEAILIVTCELHSRSERVLAGMVFPGVRILVACNPHDLEVESDHPTQDQRFWHRWLRCSLLRYAAFKASSWGIVSLDRLRFKQHAPGTA